MKRLKITKKAKARARKALEIREKLPKYKRFGLSKEKARKLGITSGVARAEQLIKNDYIDYKGASDIARFSRWLSRPRTKKIQGSIDLWGGEDFIKKAKQFVKRKNKNE